MRGVARERAMPKMSRSCVACPLSLCCPGSKGANVKLIQVMQCNRCENNHAAEIYDEHIEARLYGVNVTDVQYLIDHCNATIKVDRYMWACTCEKCNAAKR